jgi:hypothetical protein
MIRHSPWSFSILASSKVCKQQAFSRAVHGVCGDGGSTVAGERVGVAREPGADAVPAATPLTAMAGGRVIDDVGPLRC